MDVFSHGLWVGALAKVWNIKIKEKIKVWQFVFWGILPDIFSFGIIIIWAIIGGLIGRVDFSQFQHPEDMEPAQMDSFPLMRLTHFLYSLSHSAVIFLLVFLAVYFILKRPIWPMAGWLLHIIIDIPTHSYKFFPTPFLWPLSHFEINGFSWAIPWFFVLNYSALAIVYIFLYWVYKKNKTAKVKLP